MGESKGSQDIRSCCCSDKLTCMLGDVTVAAFIDYGTKKKSEKMIESNLIYINTNDFDHPELPHQELPTNKKIKKNENCTSVCGVPIPFVLNLRHAYNADRLMVVRLHAPAKWGCWEECVQPNIFYRACCWVYTVSAYTDSNEKSNKTQSSSNDALDIVSIISYVDLLLWCGKE